MRRLGFSLFSVVLLFALLGFDGPRKPKNEPEFLSVQNHWVDSVFNSLSPEQRIAQLFMVAAYSNQDMKHVMQVRDLVEKQGVGGLIWMQGGPIRHGKLATYYQSLAKVPLLYSMDAEWGLNMRLDSTPRYPRQMTLGAIRNDSLIYQMGKQVAIDCKRVGLHVNFAPVADVNNNPLNPVIGMRSFGEDRERVAAKAFMYMAGMQSQRVMANGKHFPGHGDTDADSHTGLPRIPFTRSRLDSLELYPFNYLFKRGLASIMVAHLNIPSLDSTAHLPSTLSKAVVKGLLNEEMGFKGLIFTDALNMKGVSDSFPPGDLELRCLLAGNDILLFSADVPKAMEVIKKAVADKKISQEELDEKCRRLLKAKFWCGLNRKQEVVTRNIYADLNSRESEDLNERLAAAAVTVLENRDRFLPLKGCDTLRALELSFGVEEPNTMGNTLRNYMYVEHIGLPHDATKEAVNKLFERLPEFDVVIMQVNKATNKPDKNYGVGEQTIKLLGEVAEKKPAVLVVCATPYLLNTIPSLSKFRAVIVAYEYMPSLMRAAAKVITGINGANGQLPVTTRHFKAGIGLVIKAEETARALRTEQDKKFYKVDSIALNGIAEQAYPGCQIVAMKDGKVIYQKAFGNFTYHRDSRKVDNGTLYDLASVTKIASTSLALMHLRTKGLFDYRLTLADYLPELKGTDKGALVIEDVLSHQAGLFPWIPFYTRGLEKNGEIKKDYFSKKSSSTHSVTVARNLYAINSIRDTIYNVIAASKLGPRGNYVYSDLGYYYMQLIIEKQSGKPLEVFLHDMYAELGIGLRYNPWKYFSKLQVAPTENDEKWRRQILQGYVHDHGAALMGGIAGHAGLFGNAFEVARLMQIFLNKGELNGKRVIDSTVVYEFTSCRFCPANRRGLCFEKPEPDTAKNNPVPADCSLASYGHSGFTGTYAWADPETNLVVVFLSNRVYPSSDDNKLVKMGIRTKVHQAFYEATRTP